MKKPLLFTILPLIALLATFSFTPGTIFADGAVIAANPFSDGIYSDTNSRQAWDYSDESSQQAIQTVMKIAKGLEISLDDLMK